MVTCAKRSQFMNNRSDFLIGSRPESHIRDSFDQESLYYTVTWRVVFDETFDPGRDIQAFLQDGFAKICGTTMS